MFVAHCTNHGSRVLLGTRMIDGLDNTDDGIVVRFTCFCGASGELLTGRAAHAA